MKFQTIRKVPHYVFESLDEMKEHYAVKGELMPEIVDNWRKAEVFDWVRSDDNCYVQVLKVDRTMRHPDESETFKPHEGYLRTIVGSFIIRDKNLMDTDFDIHPSRYSFAKKFTSAVHGIDGRLGGIRRKTVITKREKAFAFMVFYGDNLDPADVYMKIFRTKSYEYAKKYSIALLSQRRIMQVMKDEIAEAADKLGVDHEFVIRGFRDLYTNAEVDPAVKRLALKDLGTIIKTYPQTQGKYMLPPGANQHYLPGGTTEADFHDLEPPQLGAGDDDIASTLDRPSTPQADVNL